MDGLAVCRKQEVGIDEKRQATAMLGRQKRKHSPITLRAFVERQGNYDLTFHNARAILLNQSGWSREWFSANEVWVLNSTGNERDESAALVLVFEHGLIKGFLRDGDTNSFQLFQK